MIFQGPGALPLIQSSLEGEGPLENWQLNRGDFSSLSVSARTFVRLSCERAVLGDARWEACCFSQPEFRQCSLEGNVYDRCSMEEALYISCQLRETRLKDSSLRGGVFRGCSAPRLEVDRCRLRRISLHEPEISRARITRSVMVASLFTASHESGVTGIRRSVVDNCLFINCRFTGTVFVSSELKNCLFLGCRFIGADWEMIEWENCRFSDCDGLPRGAVNSPLEISKSDLGNFYRWKGYLEE